VVRIQKRLVKKRYYSKALYQYAVYSLNIPKKFHELLTTFLDKDLAIDVKRQQSKLIITLAPKPENPREENFS